MSKKTVEVWINEDDHLCFFNRGEETLCIRNWKELAKILAARWLGEECGEEPYLLCEPSELEGEFTDIREALDIAAQDLLDGMAEP